MTRALILVGDEKNFYDQAVELQDYLLREVGLRRHAVSLQACGHLDPEDVDSKLSLGSAKAYKQPLLVAYIGHGYEDGWSYGTYKATQPLQISYNKIAWSLRLHMGPLLLLNDCCFAAKIFDELPWMGMPSAKIGAIAACGASESTYGNTIRDILAFWRASKIYAPKRRVFLDGSYREERWGAEIDHYFFPKPV